MSQGESPANVVAPEPAANTWEYDTSRDEMRNSTTRTARLVSQNQIELGWPYGTVSGRIIVRDRAQDGLSVMFAVDEGQILCNSYSDGHLSVKFDNGPIETVGCDGAANGSSEVVFFTSERSILRKILRAQRMVVEADFYNAGPRQFTFNVSGLRWSTGRENSSSESDE